MKEQQKYNCSCNSCVRRKLVYEEELNTLFKQFTDELEYASTAAAAGGDGAISEGGAAAGTMVVPEYKKNGLLNLRFDVSRCITVQKDHLVLTEHALANNGEQLLALFCYLAEERKQVMIKDIVASKGANGDGDDSGGGSGNTPALPSPDGAGAIDSDPGADDEIDDADLSLDERIGEGKRYFLLFSAKMFEQQVIVAYKEQVALDTQRMLIEEEEAEGRKLQQKEAAKEKKRLKRLRQQQTRLEEKRRQDEEKQRAQAIIDAAVAAKAAEAAKKVALARATERKKMEAMAKERDAERKRRQTKERELQAARELQQSKDAAKAKRAKAAQATKEAKEEKVREEQEAREAADVAALAAALGTSPSSVTKKGANANGSPHGQPRYVDDGGGGDRGERSPLQSPGSPATKSKRERQREKQKRNKAIGGERSVRDSNSPGSRSPLSPSSPALRGQSPPHGQGSHPFQTSPHGGGSEVRQPEKHQQGHYSPRQHTGMAPSRGGGGVGDPAHQRHHGSPHSSPGSPTSLDSSGSNGRRTNGNSNSSPLKMSPPGFAQQSQYGPTSNAYPLVQQQQQHRSSYLSPGYANPAAPLSGTMASVVGGGGGAVGSTGSNGAGSSSDGFLASSSTSAAAGSVGGPLGGVSSAQREVERQALEWALQQMQMYKAKRVLWATDFFRAYTDTVHAKLSSPDSGNSVAPRWPGGWESVDAVSHYATQTSPFTHLRRIPNHLVDEWSQVQQSILAHYIVAKSDADRDRAVKYMSLAPELFLRLPPRGGRRGHSVVHQRFKAWRERNYGQLVDWWSLDYHSVLNASIKVSMEHASSAAFAKPDKGREDGAVVIRNAPGRAHHSEESLSMDGNGVSSSTSTSTTSTTSTGNTGNTGNNNANVNIGRGSGGSSSDWGSPNLHVGTSSNGQHSFQQLHHGDGGINLNLNPSASAVGSASSAYSLGSIDPLSGPWGSTGTTTTPRHVQQQQHPQLHDGVGGGGGTSSVAVGTVGGIWDMQQPLSSGSSTGIGILPQQSQSLWGGGLGSSLGIGESIGRGSDLGGTGSSIGSVLSTAGSSDIWSTGLSVPSSTNTWGGLGFDGFDSTRSTVQTQPPHAR